MSSFDVDEPAQGTLTAVRLDVIELPNVTLVVTPPEGPVARVLLGVAPLTIGSDPDCDVVIADARVSRCHLEISRDDRGVSLRDLGSKNGTFIDRVSIQVAHLDPGSVVTIGATHLTLERPAGSARVEVSRGIRFGAALGASLPMRALFACLENAAQTDETIVLLGESGTGKEVLARAIHDVSPRRGGPFVVFDCSAVTESLAEAELFGYVKGAFTGAVNAHAGVFEQANGGTLFIDELGELPTALQPKLLRALEARQVRRLGASSWVQFDVRIVAATHRDLRARVAEKTFREDLYYRLAVIQAQVPPLRDRREDLPLLVEHFLAKQKPPRTWADLPPNAAELMRGYDWPGNVRELRNTVARLILFPTSGAPNVAMAPRPHPFDAQAQVPALLGLPFREARDMVVEQFERAYIVAKLGEHSGNVSRTAEAMGLSRQFLHRLIERYRIERT